MFGDNILGKFGAHRFTVNLSRRSQSNVRTWEEIADYDGPERRRSPEDLRALATVRIQQLGRQGTKGRGAA
jgi:hypothetical protein